jgi:hypothetical protein
MRNKGHIEYYHILAENTCKKMPMLKSKNLGILLNPYIARQATRSRKSSQNELRYMAPPTVLA